LLADRDVPRKQRHTARGVWQRLVEEHGAVVSERQVARYVRERRRELGELGEAYVPLIAEAGVEAEALSPTSPRCWTPNTKNAPNAANAAACSTHASPPSSTSRTSASPTTRAFRRPRSPRSRRVPGSTIASRSSSSATPGRARRCWRRRWRSAPASKAGASASLRSPDSRTSSRTPTR
jgi:hypothetical protein